MIAAIAALLYGYTQSIALGALGLLIGSVLIASIVTNMGRSVLRPPVSSDRSRMIQPRPTVVLTILLAAALLLVLVPLPRSVITPAVVTVTDSRQVVLKADGALAWAIDDGSDVKTGDVLLRLENEELENRKF